MTITLLLDTSASMATGRPEKLVFAKRAAAALGYIGLASEDRVAVSALGGRASRRQTPLRGSGRVFRLLSNLSAIQPAAGPTDLVAAARHAAAQLHGRGVVVLMSDLLDPGGRSRHPRACRDPLRADRAAHPLARRARPAARGRPAARRHARPARASTSPPTSPTLDAYRSRLAAWKESFADLAARRRASYVDLSSDVPLNDLIFAELRRRRVLG